MEFREERQRAYEHGRVGHVELLKKRVHRKASTRTRGAYIVNGKKVLGASKK